MSMIAQVAGLFTTTGLAVAGAAAMSIPILIHLLSRLRRKQVPWGAMRFLQEAFRRQRRRVRIEQLLLLLLRCLVVLLLGLALAGPLAGGIAARMGAAPSGRLLVVIIDDAMSSGVSADGKSTRLDDHKSQALRTLGELGPEDRVAVLTAARPRGQRLLPPTADRQRASELIEGLSPKHARADWPAALREAAELLGQRGTDPSRSVLLLLGDFSAGALDLSRSAPRETATLGQLARVLVTRPAPDAANTQVSAIDIERPILAPTMPGPVVISAQVRLRRFGPALGQAMAPVEVAVFADDPAKPIALVRREHRWTANQASASVVVDVALPEEDAAASAALGAQPLTLTATVQSPESPDVLSADDVRWSVIERRRRVRVVLVDQPIDPAMAEAASADGARAPLRPHDWLTLALAPQLGLRATADRGASVSASPIVLTDLPPAGLDDKALSGIDAAMVLRPDLVSDVGWQSLKGLASRGGLVWVFVPPIAGAQAWTGALGTRLGVEWTLGMEAKQRGQRGSTTAPSVTTDDNDTASSANTDIMAGWPLALEGNAPEPLKLLAPDWDGLRRPVRISRRLDLLVGGAPTNMWMKVGDLQRGESPQAAALMAMAEVGDGRVAILATALDVDWTTLPTKPLFVPLIHETLRSGVGAPGEMTRLAATVCGDALSLGARWDAAQELVWLGSGSTGAPREPIRLALRRTDRGMETPTAIERPGVYAARPSTIGRWLAVNPDADAGDTRALDAEALSHWLDGLGGWSWLDAEQNAMLLTDQAARTNLGWPLLWAVLALAMTEMAVARWFSHAHAG